MTTVVNLNILNLFGLNLKRFTFNDIQFNTQTSGKRQNYSQERDRVIDITPHCRVVAEKEADGQKDRELPFDTARRAKFIAPPDTINKIYDRRGNIIQCFQSKGLYIDLYI